MTTLGITLPSPLDVAVDAQGNLFVTSRNTIVKVTPDGHSSTFAQVDFPWGLCFDRSGNLLVVGIMQDAIYKFAPDGSSSMLPGSTAHSMQYVASDSKGNVYYSEPFANRISKIKPDGTQSVFVGFPDDPVKMGPTSSGDVDAQGTAARFDMPYGLAVDAQDNLYVADFTNAKIRKVTPDGQVSTFATGIGNPHDVAFDSAGNLFVVSDNDEVGTIYEVSASGTVSTLAGGGPACHAGDAVPAYVTLDLPTTCFADGLGTAAQFALPSGIAVDTTGAVYVADQYNNRIRKVR